MTTSKNKQTPRVVDGVSYLGRSVFDDLGFAEEDVVKLISNAQEEITRRDAIKLKAVDAIIEEMARLHMDNKTAAMFLSVSNSELSNIYERKLDNFSIESMLQFLRKFGKAIEVTVVDIVEAFTAPQHEAHQTEQPAKGRKRNQAVPLA
jgi:predicted XRE-type DNA-binding protein